MAIINKVLHWFLSFVLQEKFIPTMIITITTFIFIITELNIQQLPSPLFVIDQSIFIENNYSSVGSTQYTLPFSPSEITLTFFCP